MDTDNLLQESVNYLSTFDTLGFAGMVFGLLCVWFLIKQNILTWPAGIIYVIISLVVFTQAKLYADLILHVFYLILNIYGWYYWIHPKKKSGSQVQVTTTELTPLLVLVVFSIVGLIVSGKLLNDYTDASVPYWDSATSILSITAMWLTAKKKIESWIFWLIVDVLATGIYYYKGLYFYFILYLVYTGMAVAGYISWQKSMNQAAEAA